MSEERIRIVDMSSTRTRTGLEPIQENMELRQQKFDGDNEKEASRQSVRMGCTEVHKVTPHDQEKSSIRNESCHSQNELDCSNVVLALVAPYSDECVTDIHQHDKLIGDNRPMFENGEHLPTDRKYDKEMREGEKRTCKSVLESKENTVHKPENGNGEAKEVFSVPKETAHGELHEEMVVNKKHNFSIKDECLNHDKNTCNCFGLRVTKNDHNNNPDKYQNRERQKVRRSSRINGRHVPVDDELDMGWWDVELDSFASVEMPKSDNVIVKEKPGRKQIDIEGSPVSEKMRYRKVRDLMVSSAVEEKAESCNSIDTLMQKVLSPKEADKQNRTEASPNPEEMTVQEVNQMPTSSFADENRLSCTEDECSTNETEKFDRDKNDQDGDSKMHQDGELVGSRRSSRINGRHVAVNSEIDAEILSDFMDFSSSAAKQPSVKDFGYQNVRNQKLLETHEGIEAFFHEKSFLGMKNSFVKSLTTEKHSSSRSKRKSVSDRCSNGKKKRRRRGGCSLSVRTIKGDIDETLLSEAKLTILSWLIESGIFAEYAKVVYKLKEDDRTLRGMVTRGGIWCSCCKQFLALLEFETHAGSYLHQPWNNTYLTSGKSLMQCLSEAWEKEKIERQIGFRSVGIDDADPSDDTCGACADGGRLLCCDTCTSTFHQECLMLKSLPEGNWHCPYCSCTFCLKAECGQAKFDGSTRLLSCYQCRCKYHRECVLEGNMEKMSLDSLLYCGKNCKKVASGLSRFLGASNSIGGGFSWTLLRRIDEMESIGSVLTECCILECNTRLCLALLVLYECFMPLVDPRTGIDMISQAVYNCGSNFKRLDYEGFYSVLLEMDDEIISVATLRLHGTRLAEMPFIGTRPTYRRQGMCRRLLNAIEEMLCSLHVEKLIIPATSDMVETWMKSFSFKQLEAFHHDEIRNLNMVLFADTTLLQKSICYPKFNRGN